MIFLLGSFLVGCSSNADTAPTTTNTTPATDTTPATPTPQTTPKPETASTQKAELPDLKKGLSREGCDNGPGVMGAASYFVGEITITDDGDARGEEEWVLFANKKWAGHNGADCSVRSTLSGSKTTTRSCGRCDLGVSLTNQLDVTGSNCPEDLTKGETGQSIGYDINLKDDGTVEVFFAKSGKRVGEGYHKDGTIRYVTDMSCRWF
jgi:hypothetical protein